MGNCPGPQHQRWGIVRACTFRGGGLSGLSYSRVGDCPGRQILLVGDGPVGNCPSTAFRVYRGNQRDYFISDLIPRLCD